MQASRINEWLQVVASVGVLIGLLFVAYEVRQSNIYAAAEAERSNLAGWEQISISEYETEIADIYAKSIEDPEGMSTAEMFKLNSWLTAIMNQYERALLMSDMGLGDDQINDLARWAPFFFESDFAKVWLDENKTWIDSRNLAAIQRGLASRTEEKAESYFDRFRTEP